MNWWQKLSMHRQKMYIASAVALLVVTGLLVQNRGVTYGATNGLIAFAKSDGSESQIYTMQPDGSDLHQLTSGSDNYSSPTWSPDGTKIAYVKNNGTNDQIYVMNVDGTGSVNVSNNSDNDDTPAWSPDGTKIVYAKNFQDIDIMNVDGTNTHTLASNPDQAYAPSWSPNSQSIMYTCAEGSYQQLCEINVDGTGAGQLTTNNANHFMSAWSPDGTKIVYIYETSGYVDQLAIINADGTGQQTVTTSAANNSTPAWSPDGTKIVYGNQLGGDTATRIYTINTDGSGETAVTPDDGNYALTPSWQAIQGADQDNDSSSSVAEKAGPNNGDANNDGILDYLQANVTSLINPTSNTYNVVQSNCTQNSNVSASATPVGYSDTGLTYPDGLLSFDLHCGTPSFTATVSLYFYGLGSTNGFTLRKYSSTSHTYMAVPGATLSNVSIGSQSAVKATYQITDGGPLDQDGTANGSIVDPVGLATATSTLTSTGTNIAVTSSLAALLISLAFVTRRLHHKNSSNS